MNSKMVLNIVGKIMMVLSVILVLPMIVALIYKEKLPLMCFIAVSAVSLIIGAAMSFVCKSKNDRIYAKEGFVIVTLAWLSVSVLGALPFVLSGEIPSFIDAFFETVSGFTTTGSSVVDNVEELSKSILFWRSFTHWIGGMGVLVFIMAVIPSFSDRSIHILRAEMPGPVVDKIVPRAKNMAKILYLIYIAMTLSEIALLLCGGMPLFDSIVHSFGTAGTGGFGIKADSIASYSNYSKWVISVFMMLFGINFNLYYLLLVRKIKEVFRSLELWVYISLVLVSTAIISANIYHLYGNLSSTFRDSFFQVTSLVSTTGYSTANFDAWPTLSKGIMLTLMISGACAGSTAGGFKLSRVILLVKAASRHLKSLTHPRSVSVVKIDGKAIEESTISNVLIYGIIYAICIVVVFLLLCIEPFDIETNLSAAISCFNNIGPGFAKVGPSLSYSHYSDFSKILLSFAMLMGRLEIFPILLTFSPSVWRKGK